MKKKSILIVVAILLALLIYLCPAVHPATETEIPSPEPEVIEELFVFDSGVCSDFKYENTSLGISFTLPDGWFFSDVDSLKDNSTLGEELPSFAYTDTFYEFYACDAVGRVESLIFVVEDMTAHDTDGLISEAMFIETLSEQYLSVESVSYSLGESYNTTIVGIDMTVLPTYVKDLGLQQRNYVSRIDHYMLSFTTTAYSDEALDAIEAAIS